MVNTPVSNEFVGLRQAMDRLLDESFVGGPFRTLWSQGGAGGSGFQSTPLPLDVYATPDEAVIIAAVPGMNPQALDVTINQNTVTLSGTVPSAAESEQGKGATWYLHELWHGPFRRSLTLPFEVDAGRAEATFENGIVRIVLPKAEQAKPHKIAVKAAGGHEAISAGGEQPQKQ